MGVAWFTARANLRRRAAAWVFLVVLVAVVVGAVLATVAGARRTGSAFERFVTEAGGGDANVLGFGVPPGSLDKVAALPEVADSLKGSLVLVAAVGARGPYAFDTALVVTRDERLLDGTFERPIVVDGRTPDLTNPSEIMVNDAMIQKYGWHVGDRVEFDVLDPAQIAAAAESGQPAGPPTGPRVPVTIAGVMRLPQDLTDTGHQGLGYASGAFFDRWASRLPLDTEILTVRLRSPSLVASFAAHAVALVPGAEVAFGSDRVVKDATRVQSLGLAALSGIVAIAGVVALGQALSRTTSLDQVDRAVHAAAGMTRWERTSAEALPALVAIAAGTLIGVGGAVVASPLFPTGLAGRAEFQPGVRLDPLVLVLGGVLAVLTLAAWVVIASRFSIARDRAPGRSDTGPPGRSQWLSGVRMLGPAAATGVRFALQRGKGRRATPTASSLAAGAVGIAGVVGVVVFGASLGHLLATPGLAGSRWDAESVDVPDAFVTQAVSRLDASSFDGIATIRSGQVIVGGRAVEGYGISEVRGSRFVSVLSGRAPAASNEAALGSRTLERQRLHVGGEVTVGAPGGTSHRFRIVGRVALPVLNTDVDRLAEGVLLARPALDDILGSEADAQIALVLRSASGIADFDRLDRLFGANSFSAPPEPRELTNMRAVRTVPALIGGLTALLALVSIGHLLVVGARRRRGELGVLRAIGFRPGQVRAAFRWQALTMAVAALLVGVPAGVLAGELAWTPVATQLGVVDVAVLRWSVLALLALGITVASVALAMGPGWRAGKFSPAEALRVD